MDAMQPPNSFNPFASTDKAQASFQIGPAPAWITSRSIPWRTTGKPEDHAFVLLSDCQRAPLEAIRYEREVRRLVTKDAVQRLSQVELQWDPETEILRLHEVALWREGASRSFCERARVLLRQREGNLESQILHGRMSAILLLDDVRPGDSIEVVHSIQTVQRHPGERFDFFFLLDRSTLTGSWSFSVHLPEGATCQIHTSISPQVYASGGQLVREWSGTQPENREPEPLTPPWHSPLPFGHCSAYQNWGEVAGFLWRIWSTLATDTPELRSLAQQISSAHETSEAKAQALVRWVQDDVRYLGLEMGLGGTLPSAPTEVASRRYGDCKDKSLLLVALLGCAGIPAAPVLVHTALRHQTESLLPGLSGFDHAIAVLWLDGSPIFIDTTLSNQGGGLRDRCLPQYGKGLILSEETSGLTDILTPILERSSLSYTEDIHLHSRAGISQVDWRVEAVGWEADMLRARLQSVGPDAFAKVEAQDAQEILPDAQSLAPCRVNDQLHENRIILTGTFAFGDWGMQIQKGLRSFRWLPLRIRTFLSGAPISVQSRNAPLYLRHPGLFRQRIRIHYSAHLHRQGVRQSSDNKWFRALTTVSRISADVVQFDFAYQSLRNEVTAEQYPEYAEAFRKFVDSQLGVQLVLSYSAAEPAPLRGGPTNKGAEPTSTSDPQADMDLLAATNAASWFDGPVPRAAWSTRLRLAICAPFSGPTGLRRKVYLAFLAIPLLNGLLNHPNSKPNEHSAGGNSRQTPVAPTPPPALLQTAQLDLESGNLTHAENILRPLLETRIDDTVAVRMLMEVLIRTQRRSEAVAIGERALEKHAQDALLWDQLSAAYGGLQLFDKAHAAATKAIELDPSDPIHASSFVLLLINQSRINEALRKARELEIAFPEHPRVLNALAASTFAAGEPASVEFFRRLQKKEPTLQNTLNLAIAFLHFGKPDELPPLIEPLRQSHPRVRKVWELLESAYRQLGQREKQSDASARILELPPQ
jgi:tetratricopeptide (TPR) repeat protein